MKITTAFTFLLSLAMLVQTPYVHATNTPSFPTCPNPGGTQIAGYAHGTHQIPGGERKEGSDYVYRVGDDKFVQCFCPEYEGSGIQSNWLHEKYLTPVEEQELMDHGWMKIENGSDWGLPSGAYFVKNHSFNCTECRQKDKEEHTYRLNTNVTQTNWNTIYNFLEVQGDSGHNEINHTYRTEPYIHTGNSAVNIEVWNEVGGNFLEIN
jgi:hypothetical protein